MSLAGRIVVSSSVRRRSIRQDPGAAADRGGLRHPDFAELVSARQPTGLETATVE
jgi:hypothetical protein